jgi:uncharacterized membrane protein
LKPIPQAMPDPLETVVLLLASVGSGLVGGVFFAETVGHMHPLMISLPEPKEEA